VNLRSDIHDAIDEVAAPAPMLAGQVEAFVLTEGRERRGSWKRRRWPMRLADTAAAVAAVLVVVLVATILVGGRAWRELNAYGYQLSISSQVAALEARPLKNLPTVPPGAPCPAGPYNQILYLPWLEQPQFADNADVYGGGPAYEWEPGLNTNVIRTDWGTWIETNFLAGPTSSGLMLFRARDLRTNQPIVFAENPYADSSRNDGFVTGDVVGQDSYVERAVQERPMLVIDASHPSTVVANRNRRSYNYFEVSVLVGYPKGNSDCFGFQVDGPGFTEVFVVTHTYPSVLDSNIEFAQ
jgi:hypothetical protein